jgi:phosphoribosylaminoimidazole-succinocarboxamide synthase
MSSNTILSVQLPGIPKLKSGKVRELFDLGDQLLLVATDRISAFDVIMPNGIPHKGEVLIRISHFWPTTGSHRPTPRCPGRFNPTPTDSRAAA